MTRADVILWGRRIGAALWDDRRDIGAFEYVPEFTRSGIEPAPLVMPLRPGVFEFPDLPRGTFKGLPGLLADSLPDKFGNLLINRWLAAWARWNSNPRPGPQAKARTGPWTSAAWSTSPTGSSRTGWN